MDKYFLKGVIGLTTGTNCDELIFLKLFSIRQKTSLFRFIISKTKKETTTTTAVSRSFCLSKVEKATFVMVCIGDRGEKKESGLNATSSRALESYD